MRGCRVQYAGSMPSGIHRILESPDPAQVKLACRLQSGSSCDALPFEVRSFRESAPATRDVDCPVRQEETPRKSCPTDPVSPHF